MTRHPSVIRILVLCVPVMLLGCKPKPKAVAVPEVAPVVAPAPPRPDRPLAQFVKEALELHFSPERGAMDSDNYRDRDLPVQIKGLQAADLPAKAHQTRFHVATRQEIESTLRASPGDHHPYLGVEIGEPDKEGNRILGVGFGALLKTKDGDFEDWASGGCEYVETWKENTFVVIRRNAWVQ